MKKQKKKWNLPLNDNEYEIIVVSIHLRLLITVSFCLGMGEVYSLLVIVQTTAISYL